jgi:hypothetical protein
VSFDLNVCSGYDSALISVRFRFYLVFLGNLSRWYAGACEIADRLKFNIKSIYTESTGPLYQTQVGEKNGRNYMLHDLFGSVGVTISGRYCPSLALKEMGSRGSSLLLENTTIYL